MNPSDVRETIICRLTQDLIGPHKDNEILEGRRLRPSDMYLTGILWPLGDRMTSAEDEREDGDDEDDESPSSASPIGQQRPCTMGISFCVGALEGASPINLAVQFSTYAYEAIPDEKGKSTNNRWSRRPFSAWLQNLVLPESGHRTEAIDANIPGVAIEIHIRTRASPTGRLVTLTLINRSQPALGDRNKSEEMTLFQTSLRVWPAGSTRIVPRPPRPSANDEDEEVGRLLYRGVPEFATGHQCSAAWVDDGETASVLSTEWIPRASVIAYREDGDEVFDSLVKEDVLVAQKLAHLDKDTLIQCLVRLPEAYGKWIERQEEKTLSLPHDLRGIADRNLTACRAVKSRMMNGITAMAREPRLLESFQLANAAMALQHSWKSAGGSRSLNWRPFQLGFILLAAESVCLGSAPDRNTLDLLWFPTGGGKTEAYLALVAMLAFYRRLDHVSPEAGEGNSAVMRYTLRLLTAQQFERATSLILACDLIRRGMVSVLQQKRNLGSTPFSIGLWVGGEATPNNFADAIAAQGRKSGSTAEQIDECPCCRGRVAWQYDEANASVTPCCENGACLLGPNFGAWPVYTTDNMIYRHRPTLVIGTIDKFALLATREEVKTLFGFGTAQSTDLIIQDELHLIAGPLGTIAGIYEMAFDWLLRKEGCRPKVIGSTATIRRASEQVKSLFDRESCLFPPAGLDHDDSGFAVRDQTKQPRVYLGITTAGRSAKFALQATAGSLLQSSGSSAGWKDRERDGYATMLAYFNSLRELGGAIVQMLDDVPDSIRLYSEQRGETGRSIGPPRELTSRVPQKEIVEILSELRIESGKPGAIDVVLATNMVSVGVDVSRLGIMFMNGQPKTRSEYIQATSRVGRAHFPGLVIALFNAAKPRDRSHYETFSGWHMALYRDVEATSVTPFASRARDRALHAALVAMIRHGAQSMSAKPDLGNAPSDFLISVIEEIERRVGVIDPDEKTACAAELDSRLQNWMDRAPNTYNNPYRPATSLLISADLNAQRKASGRLPASAWPTMNNMRSVEATTRFRMAEVLTDGTRKINAGNNTTEATDETRGRSPPRWRRNNG